MQLVYMEKEDYAVLEEDEEMKQKKQKRKKLLRLKQIKANCHKRGMNRGYRGNRSYYRTDFFMESIGYSQWMFPM